MTQATILPDRLARFADVHLRSGVGKGANGNIDVCAMQAADWLAGGTGVTDAPECVCPVIRSYMIGLNDSTLFTDHRDELKTFVVRSIGSRGTIQTTVTRARIVAEDAARYANYATESAKSAAKYAEYAANYATESAEYAAKSAAESAVKSVAKFAAKYAESAAKYAAELRMNCLACLESMIAYTGDPR